MMKVVPYDPSHEEVYNVFITKTWTEPKTEVFSAKRTETDRQETFWNRNNTRPFILKLGHNIYIFITPDFSYLS